MKTRYNILYISVLFLTGMTACAKEDTLTPEVDTNIDCFAPAADAMDEESVLRRTFFEQENCYLLFSDTLRREELGNTSLPPSNLTACARPSFIRRPALQTAS